MGEFLHQAFQPDPLQAAFNFLLGCAAYILLGLLPAIGALYVIYFLLTLPLRRNERVRLFLDLLELGLKAGRTPETAITEVAASQDRALGVRFHLLAAYLKEGMRLDQGLDLV